MNLLKIVKVLGSAIKFVSGPASNILNKIPEGHATGTGLAVALAGVMVHFAITKGWIPNTNTESLIGDVAKVLELLGAYIITWGTGRAKTPPPA